MIVIENDLNFSCPAVSHNCSFILILPFLIVIIFAKKSTPTVGSLQVVNWESVNTRRSVDLPTVESPISIKLIIIELVLIERKDETQ